MKSRPPQLGELEAAVLDRLWTEAPGPRSRRRPPTALVLAGVLAAATLACAGPRPPGVATRAPEAPASSPPAEDALPSFLDESAVDAPARPRTPIRPDYPLLARSQGLEGDVTLRAHVRGDGQVVGLELVEGDREAFVDAAARAVRATSFEPGRVAGRPVSSTVTVRVRFRVD